MNQMSIAITPKGEVHVGITWNSVAGGVTWDGPARGMHRRILVGSVAFASVAALAAMPHASAAGTPLPDLSSVEQVVGAQQAWQTGANGQGVDVAVVDTGVSPVAGLDGANKLVYGPDLSFDSQSESTTHRDGYGHGTVMASIIAGN